MKKDLSIIDMNKRQKLLRDFQETAHLYKPNQFICKNAS